MIKDKLLARSLRHTGHVRQKIAIHWTSRKNQPSVKKTGLSRCPSTVPSQHPSGPLGVLSLLNPISILLLLSRGIVIVRYLPREVDPLVYNMSMEDPGDINYNQVGGLGDQVRELREVIELPLINPELFQVRQSPQPLDPLPTPSLDTQPGLELPHSTCHGIVEQASGETMGHLCAVGVSS